MISKLLTLWSNISDQIGTGWFVTWGLFGTVLGPIAFFSHILIKLQRACQNAGFSLYEGIFDAFRINSSGGDKIWLLFWWGSGFGELQGKVGGSNGEILFWAINRCIPLDTIIVCYGVVISVWIVSGWYRLFKAWVPFT